MTVFFLLLSLFSILIVNGRVFEIYTQDHLHDIIQDTPVGNRAGIVIAFYNDNKECKNALHLMQFDDHNLPTMQHIILAQYELSGARKRVWHDYESHLDLASNLGVTNYLKLQESSNNGVCQCPLLVYLPVAYSNYVGDWYRNQPNINDTSLNLIYYYDNNEQIKYSNWKSWLWSKLQTSIRIISREPFNFEVTIVPHAGRLQLLNDEEDNNDEKQIFINAFSDYIIIDNIYIGDTIFISQNPIYPHTDAEIYMLKQGRETKDNNGEIDYKSLKPTTNAPNPMYEIYGIDYMRQGMNGVMGGDSEINTYYLKILEDGRYGFDISGKLDEVQNNIGLIKRRHSTTCMTHTRNLVLPKVLQTKNNPGFKKIKMPDGLHERLLRFYRHWYHLRATEGWDSTGTQLNFMSVKSFMISLDHNFKERNSIAEDVVKPILSQWSGGQQLEFTAFYGIREYERNAVLRNHVDRIETHVFSAILQIAQTDLDEPWTLEVVGFDGKYYEIELFPGEMALYEGHALIHGRPKPLNGTLFANAFVHFKPIDWKFTTGGTWKEQVSKETLDLLHVRLQDLYR